MPAPETPTAIRLVIARRTPAVLPATAAAVLDVARRRASAADDLADDASRRPRGSRAPRSARGTAAGATTTIIPRPPLNVARSSASSSPPSAPNRRMTDGIGQRAGSTRTPRSVGQGARHVAGQSAAGDVGEAVDVVPGRDQRARGRPGPPGVDPRRRQQDVAERRQRRAPARPPGIASRPASPSVRAEPRLVRLRRDRVPLGEERADERVAVRVEARTTARPTIDVAGPGRRAVDEPRRARRRRRRSPGEVERVGVHEARVLGRLAAHERAAGLAAAGRDAADELGDRLGLEPAHRDVVEERERLGAEADDVVGAHRDEVDADRVEPADAPRRSPSWCRRRRSRRRAPARGSRPGCRTPRRSRRGRRRPPAARSTRRGRASARRPARPPRRRRRRACTPRD